MRFKFFLFLFCLTFMSANAQLVKEGWVTYRILSGGKAMVDDVDKDASGKVFICSVVYDGNLDEGGNYGVVEGIGPYAFDNCKEIECVLLPSTLKYFSNMSGLGPSSYSSVICSAETPPNAKNVFGSSFRYATLYVPSSSVEKYKDSEDWNKFYSIEAIQSDSKIHKLRYFLDGEMYKTYSINEGSVIIPEETPQKEHYHFSGWSKIPNTMPGYDIVVKGLFSINKHKLTYMVDGEEYKSYTYNYDSEIIPLDNPTKNGYTFSGWSDIPETMPDYDVTVTGSFSANTYKLTYKVDGNEYKVIEIKYGESVEAEPDPHQKGMTFSGWKGLPETMPAKDVEVTGAFSWSKSTIDNVVYQITDTISNYCAVMGNENASGVVKIVSSVDFDYTYSITKIVDKAFYGRKAIITIEIPATVTTIGERAFANIDKLNDVYCYAAEVPNTDRTAFENSYIEDYVTLHVPESAVEKYKSTAPWKNFKEIVGISGEVPQPEPTKCALPTISYDRGRVRFACDTDGVTFKYKVTCPDAVESEGSEVVIGGVYEVSVYAVKDGLEDSETATMRIQLQGDRNNDGVVDSADIISLVNLMLSTVKSEE